MGNIQNALNQTLGTLGIAARLSPGYETKQELHNLGKQEKVLNEQAASLNVDLFEYEEGKTIEAKQAREIIEKQAKVKQRQFELKPSKQSAAQASMYRSGAGEGPIMVFPADEDEIRAEQAMLKVAKKQNAQLKQKRRFKDYIKELSPEFQETAMNLPKWAKTEYMNIKDREKMNKDGK